MAFRYLAADARSLRGSSAVEADPLHVVPSRIDLGRHLLLASDASRVLPLAGRRGAVLGTLFRRGPPSRRVRRLDAADCGLLASDAERAGREFWGAYVVVLADGDELVVRRDPSGMLPCLLARSVRGLAFASDVALLRATGMWCGEVDLGRVARVLWSGDLPDGGTCLTGVEEVRPGTEVTMLGDVTSVRDWWSPWDQVPSPRESGPDSDRLREIVVDAVAACCSPHDRLLLGVSGGLDSSIVAASVPDATHRLTCFTAFTPEAKGDERRRSQELAAHVGAPLREVSFGSEAEDLWRSAAAHSPRPCSRVTVNAYARLQRCLGAATAVDAHLSGHGGDNVFGLTSSAAPVVDRAMAEGVVAACSTVLDVAALTGGGAPAVVGAALRRWRAGPRYRWRHDDRYIDPGVARGQASVPIRHPWLSPPPGAVPGKAAHVAAILRGQVHVGGLLGPELPPTLCPLLSQPVMEACLSVPSWRWCEGGVNRALARRAFAPVLPRSVVERRSKGSPDGHSRAILEHHRTSMRERLLDGRLASSGVLDRKALETAMAGSHVPAAGELVRLFSILDAEVWTSHWSG